MDGEAASPAIRRTEMHLRGAEGPRGAPLLLRRGWRPEEAWGVLLLVHGYAEHSGRYEDLGSWFAGRGLAVEAYDQRGHGRSEGARCHVDRFGEFLDDLDRVLERVREEHPELPIVLLGHSMGGLVVSAFLADRRPTVAAAVTSGAALSVGPGVSRGRVMAARVLRRLAPRLALGSGLDPAGLSRDAEVVQRYLDDPLVYRTMTTSLAAELLGAIPEVAKRAVEVQVPLLMLHGSEDPLCPIEGSRAFHGGVRVPGSAFRAYPGLLHEIFNEPEREQVFEDLLAWVRATLRPEALRAERAAAGIS
jgi:alpha-beta hydrolase superfamily lysophospholipase